MKLKLDENLGHYEAGLFRSADHDVSTVFDQGLAGGEDRSVIECCRAESRTLVTYDLGFSNPIVFPPRDYPGIIVIRIPRQSTRSIIELGIRTTIEALRHEKIDRQLWTIDSGRVRIYRGQFAYDEFLDGP